MKLYKNFSGFTLVELMIVILIIGLLAGIGYPAYQSYVMKSRRAEAKSALVSLQQAQEKFRANCTSYASGYVYPLSSPASSTQSVCAGGVYNLVNVNASSSAAATSENGYYTISITASSSSGYTLQATPVSGKAQEKDTDCAKFTIDQTGRKTAYNNATTPSDTTSQCWST